MDNINSLLASIPNWIKVATPIVVMIIWWCYRAYKKACLVPDDYDIARERDGNE